MKRGCKGRGRKNILCMHCGHVFQMENREIYWYKRIGFRKPCLCKFCRAERRRERGEMQRYAERYSMGKNI